jgi:hypothetical protein
MVVYVSCISILGRPVTAFVSFPHIWIVSIKFFGNRMFQACAVAVLLVVLGSPYSLLTLTSGPIKSVMSCTLSIIR